MTRFVGLNVVADLLLLVAGLQSGQFCYYPRSDIGFSYAVAFDDCVLDCEGAGHEAENADYRQRMHDV